MSTIKQRTWHIALSHQLEYGFHNQPRNRMFGQTNTNCNENCLCLLNDCSYCLAPRVSTHAWASGRGPAVHHNIFCSFPVDDLIILVVELVFGIDERPQTTKTNSKCNQVSWHLVCVEHVLGKMWMIPVRGPQTWFLASLGDQAKPPTAICLCISGLGKSRQVYASLGKWAGTSNSQNSGLSAAGALA